MQPVPKHLPPNSDRRARFKSVKRNQRYLLAFSSVIPAQPRA